MAVSRSRSPSRSGSASSDRPASLLGRANAAAFRRQQPPAALVWWCHDGQRGAGAGVIWRDRRLHRHQSPRHRRRQNPRHPGGWQRAPGPLGGDRTPRSTWPCCRLKNPICPPSLLADSRGLRVGQVVLAVGHPWGQRGFVTGGIISSLGALPRADRASSVPIIRSDVTLAPGNSGGPLANATRRRDRHQYHGGGRRSGRRHPQPHRGSLRRSGSGRAGGKYWA